MAPITEQILQAALTLPDAARHELIEALIAASERTEGLPFDQAWRATVLKRSAALDSGTVQALAWPEVRDRVHQRVGFSLPLT